MADLALVGAHPARPPQEPIEQRLAAQLDHRLLAEIGWDPDRMIFMLPSGHPVVGWDKCFHPGCRSRAATAAGRQGLCDSCDIRRQRLGLPTVEDYLAVDLAQHAVWVRGGVRPICRVPHCERPTRGSRLGLCTAHHTWVAFNVPGRRPTSADVDEFLAAGRLRPRPSWGPCRAACCLNLAGTPRHLCFVHDDRWRTHRRQSPDADFDQWCATVGSITATGVINLRGLQDRLRLQILVGFQRRVQAGNRHHVHRLNGLVDQLRRHRVACLLDETTMTLSEPLEDLLHALQDESRLALADPVSEQRKRVWDMRVFGVRGTVDFTAISQPWLEAITRAWVLEELPTRYGSDVAAALRDHVNSVSEFAGSLSRTSANRGMDPARLIRGDIVTFLNDLGQRQRTGQMSLDRRSRIIRNVRTVVRIARDTGQAGPGQPIERLPAEVSIRVGDIPAQPPHTAEGKALPSEIMAQIVAALSDLERRCGPTARTAVELLIHTGRRPDEICQLPLECLDVGGDGKAVLRYTDFKQNRPNRRLPIGDDTADLIRSQQQRVESAFPQTPNEQLMLIPARTCNPHGTKSTRATTLSNLHRDWIQRQPDFTFSDGTVFAKQRIVPYAYRHSYAQRHADAGTPVDVLRDLMGHRLFASTQTYYRITEKRTRAAIDALTLHQLDGAGRRIWRDTAAVLDSERARQRIGEVAVPFGNCTEPSNVAAGGGACPYRFRCTGCGHFRTDASYLPELRSYLDQLLTNRERVAASTELDDWARREATPSDAEISQVRQLIRRVEQHLDELSPSDRASIAHAVDVVRSNRRHITLLGMPQLAPPAATR